jgi:hypothetical protein
MESLRPPFLYGLVKRHLQRHAQQRIFRDP